MISEKIKFDFDQILYGLTAFVGTIQLKLQNIMPDLPVFVLQTGDTSYVLDKKFTKVDNKEIYEKTPRVSITIDDIQPLMEQDTNKYNKITYIFADTEYICQGRRVAINIPINIDFISPNFILGLRNYTIMLSILKSVSNVYTYDFLGSTYEAGFEMTSNSTEKPSMDFGSGTRNVNMKNMLDLQLQLLIPNVESITKLSDIGYEQYQFDIHSSEKDKHILIK